LAISAPLLANKADRQKKKNTLFLAFKYGLK
jgi:hypothetical protein